MYHAAIASSLALAATLAAGVEKDAPAGPPADSADKQAVSPAARNVDWPFFAFDNGVGRDQGWRPERQAKLIARLGFDGIGYTRAEDLVNRYAACDANGLRIFSLYEAFTLGEDPPVSSETLKCLPHLKGRNVVLWIHLHGEAPEDEAVAALQAFSDQVRPHGVRVAIYPHVGNYVETGRRALRLAKAVGRENFGMSINVCHELKAGNADDLGDLAKDSADHLFLVSINGADRVEDPAHESGWTRLIQPLGEGNLDLRPFLRQLSDSRYKGPIGLQCYQVDGEIDEVLAKSMRGWKELAADIGSDE